MARTPDSGSPRSAPSRRQFLKGSVGVGGGLLALAAGVRPDELDTAPAPAGTLPAPSLKSVAQEVWLEGRNADDFIIHVAQPLAMETRRSRLGMSAITPTNRFYVRNNVPAPSPSILEAADEWEMEVAGVANPGTLTLAQLKTMPSETVAVVVQCSGNGRKFFEHPASGSQWEVGAAGCALWTGVRVSDVIDRMGGPAAGMRFLTATGAEEIPEGIDPLSVLVERSVPLEKGMADAILAWEMNGGPIPLLNGGPLRLIVPGYYGINHIKYVSRIAPTAEETRAAIQATGYRFRPIGQPGRPDQETMWELNVKSWLNGPGADDQPVLAGKNRFHGVAFSGRGAIEAVDYSVDGGSTWAPATFYGPDLGPWAWRTFSFELDLPPGEHRIATRARDASGDVQPAEREENERAYGHNGWRDHSLHVRTVTELPRVERTPAGGGVDAGAAAAVAAGPRVALSAEAEQGRTIFLEETDPSCGRCHIVEDAGTTGRLGPNLNTLVATEDRIVSAILNGAGTMPGYADKLTPEQVRLVARYLTEVAR